MKKILIKIRTSMKFLVLISCATFFTLAIVTLLYKPIYSVSLNGKLLGYCENKKKLQARISDYVENGEGDNENLAYVSIDYMPKYKMCLLKRGITTNDDEIFEKIKETGVAYYKYYAILEDKEEKVYVSNFDTAEAILEKLEQKDSNNIDDINIIEKYETELTEFSNEEDAVSKLYEKKVVAVAKVTQTTSRGSRSSSSSNGTLKMSYNISKQNVNIGVNLIKPVTGVITSRFGVISSVRSGAHTGLDISAPKGTAIKAAASGTVTYAGWRGGYGYLAVISHGNGVQTYYAHCSKLYVSVGDKVSQGKKIAAVGSTGNSTGPHLHLEVRVNGVAYNPQHYVY